jgi:hypothetical protein
VVGAEQDQHPGFVRLESEKAAQQDDGENRQRDSENDEPVKAGLTAAALQLAHEEREPAEKKDDVQDEHEPAVEGGPDNLAIGVIDAIWFRHRVSG